MAGGFQPKSVSRRLTGGSGLFHKRFLGRVWTHLNVGAKFFRPIEWPRRALRVFLITQKFSRDKNSTLHPIDKPSRVSEKGEGDPKVLSGPSAAREGDRGVSSKGKKLVIDMLDLIAGASLQPKAPPQFGELAPKDVEAGPNGPSRSTVLRLRHTHHMLARALAEGKSNIAAAAISGYAPSTVSALKADPAFQELVAHYSAQVDDLFAQIHDRIGALGVSFLDEIQQRFETSPESFSIGQLQKMSEFLLDRSVAPAKNGLKAGPSGPTAISVKIDFGGQSAGASPILELEATQV